MRLAQPFFWSMCVMFGMLMGLPQQGTGRMFSVLGIIANALGAGAGIAGWHGGLAVVAMRRGPLRATAVAVQPPLPMLADREWQRWLRSQPATVGSVSRR